jgi:hypothetical protein
MPCPSSCNRLALVALALTLGSAVALPAQRPNGRSPFGVGESLIYDVRYLFATVGTGKMEVTGIEDVRGRDAWRVRLEIDGGIPGFRVRYLLESWIDTATFSSLRFVSESNEAGRLRRDAYEIFPERGTYSEVLRRYNEKTKSWDETRLDNQAATADPLDQAAFLFFARTQPLDVGVSYSFPRYFKPDRNPVQLTVLRREKTTLPAGPFSTIVVRPVFKTRGLFSQNGRAEVWFTDDDRRLMVRMETSLAFGTVSLLLKEFQNGLR